MASAPLCPSGCSVGTSQEPIGLLCLGCGLLLDGGDQLVADEPLDGASGGGGGGGRTLVRGDRGGGGLVEAAAGGGSQARRPRGEHCAEEARERARAKAQATLGRVLATLRLQPRLRPAVEQLLHQLVGRDEWGAGTGQWVTSYCGCCCYFVARREGLPLALSAVASACGVDVYRLGRLEQQLSQRLQLRLPVTDASHFLEAVVQALDVGAHDPRELLRVARWLVGAASDAWVSEGRQVRPVAAAAVIVAAASLQPKLKLTAHQVSERLSGEYGAERTIRTRATELRKALLPSASALPDVTGVVTERNLPQHIPALMARGGRLGGEHLPASFVRAQKRKEAPLPEPPPSSAAAASSEEDEDVSQYLRTSQEITRLTGKISRR